MLESLGITVRTGREKEFDRLPLGRDQEVKFQAVEVAAFAGLITAPSVSLVTARPGNADIVTSSDGKTINHIDAFGVQLMTPLRQAIEQGHQQWRTPMQAAVKTTGAEAAGQITLFMEKLIGALEVSAKIAGRDQGDGENFGSLASCGIIKFI